MKISKCNEHCQNWILTPGRKSSHKKHDLLSHQKCEGGGGWRTLHQYLRECFSPLLF